mgnify:CR=1 FL=1
MTSYPLNLKSLSVLLVIIFALIFVQSRAGQAEVVENSAAHEEIPGNILEPFAGAYKEVSEIHSSYEQRIVKSLDPAQADALQQEANQKMTQAVTDRGMTIADYNTLFQTIQNDPDLKEKFMTVLNQTR